MEVVIDIEADGLENPQNIWLIVCKDIATGELHIFREVTSNEQERRRFILFAANVTRWVGHHVLGYDYPVMHRLLGLSISISSFIDTLIISKLVNYSRNGHSIEDYGIEFGFEKIKFSDFSKYSQEMETYCVRDVDICLRIYQLYLRVITDTGWQASIELEHSFQLIVNSLHNNGFSFNADRCARLLATVTGELEVLDKEISSVFPPRLKLIREITPKVTKHGTLAKTDFRFIKDGNLSDYNGGPFCRCEWVDFNPSSHKQIVEVLINAKWSPVDKTQTHIETERELNRLKYNRNRTPEVDLRTSELYNKLQAQRLSGWKINEANLSTLPEEAPKPAKTLAKRILLESRRRTLTEWLNLICFEIKIDKENISELGRAINDVLIQNGVPRNKNITDKDLEKEIWICLDALASKSLDTLPKRKENAGIISGITTTFLSKTLIGWLKSRKVNANFVRESESSVWITLMYPEKSEDFSVKDAIPLLDGLKESGLKYSITSERIRGRFYGIGAWTHRMAHQNPNTANIPTDAKLYGGEMRALWQAPKKRLLVGVDAEGIQLRIFAHYIDDPEFTRSLVEGKKDDKTDPHSLNARILGSVCGGRQIAKRFIYALLLGAGIGKLAEILGCSKEEAQIALNRLLERYEGFATLKQEVLPVDGRRGFFIGLDGRKVPIPGETPSSRTHLAMSGYLQNGESVVMKKACLLWHKMLEGEDALIVNFVHDEFIVECPNDMKAALHIAKTMADSIRIVGEELNLRCPLAGSYYNEDHQDYTIGTSWAVTH